MDSFSADVAKDIGLYVYRLIDPRNGHTFYVGKGVGDRAFAHAKAAITFNDDTNEDEASEKISRILDIIKSDLEPQIIIHRHNLRDDNEAFTVESALMDAFPGLSNIQGGHQSEFGASSPQQLEADYGRKEFEPDPSQKIILISIGNSFDEDRTIYDATRFAWRMAKDRAKQSDLVLAISQKVCRGVFRPTEWLDATEANFPSKVTINGRIGFVGEELTSGPDFNRYYNRKLPKSWEWKRGQATPFQYKYGKPS